VQPSQPSRHQSLADRVKELDGGVIALLDEIRLALREVHLHGQIGVAPQEIGQSRRDAYPPEQRGRADP